MVPNEETQAMDARLQEQVKAMQATQGRFVIAFAAVAFVLHWGWETAHGRAYVETNLPLVQRFWHCFPMAVVDTAWSGAVVLLAAAVARALRCPSSIWPAAAAAGALTAVAVERFALETSRWTYTDAMPIVAFAGVGVWPIAQMTVLPPLTLYLTTRLVRCGGDPHLRWADRRDARSCRDRRKPSLASCMDGGGRYSEQDCVSDRCGDRFTRF